MVQDAGHHRFVSGVGLHEKGHHQEQHRQRQEQAEQRLPKMRRFPGFPGHRTEGLGYMPEGRNHCILPPCRHLGEGIATGQTAAQPSHIKGIQERRQEQVQRIDEQIPGQGWNHTASQGQKPADDAESGFFRLPDGQIEGGQYKKDNISDGKPEGKPAEHGKIHKQKCSGGKQGEKDHVPLLQRHPRLLRINAVERNGIWILIGIRVRRTRSPISLHRSRIGYPISYPSF